LDIREERRREERREGGKGKKGFEAHRFRTMRDDVKTYSALVLGGMEGRKEGGKEGTKERRKEGRKEGREDHLRSVLHGSHLSS